MLPVTSKGCRFSPSRVLHRLFTHTTPHARASTMGTFTLRKSSRWVILSWDLGRRKETMLELEQGLGTKDGDWGTCTTTGHPTCPPDAPWDSRNQGDPGLGDACRGKGVLGWGMLLGACPEPKP